MYHQTILFQVLDKSPLLGLWTGPPHPRTTADHKEIPIFTVADILTAQGTPGPARLLTVLTQWLQLGPVCPRSLLMETTGQSAPTGLGTRDFVDPFYLTPLFNPSYPILIFSCPLVLDAEIWSMGLSLS